MGISGTGLAVWVNRANERQTGSRGSGSHSEDHDSFLKLNSNGLQLALASKGCAACLFPQFLTPLGNMMNQAGGSLEHINLYPVADLGYQNEISLFYGKHKHLPQYMKYFISLVQKAFYEYPPKNILGIGEDRGQTP